MDVNYVSGPVIFGSVGDKLVGLGFEHANDPGPTQFRAYWATKLEQFGNVALAVGAARVIVKGTLFSRSFNLSPGLAKSSLFVFPFSLAAERPGVLHLFADAVFYKGALIYDAIADAAQRANAWLDTVTRGTLLNSLGPAAYDRLTAGGTITTILADVEMPPVWLNDP